MKILTVTNMWPNTKNPYYGIFVKEQVEALYANTNISNRVFFIDGKKSRLNYLYSLIKINWLILFNKFDVIHVHYALSGLFLLFNPFVKKRVIITLHGSDYHAKGKLLKLLIKLIIKRSSVIICLNKSMLQNLSIYNKTLFMIPCGVNTDIFKPERKNTGNSKFQIVFPSSRSRVVKNYPFFQKVINEVIELMNCEIEVIEIDSMTRIEICQILNAADLICMTSFTEGSPQIIKEAMACNLPIVSSNVGDVKDLLQGVNNCYVLDGYNSSECRDVIIKILKIEKEKRISDGYKRVYELGLNQDRIGKKLVKVYSSITKLN